MRKDFYIFRHGETDYNKQGRWQGQGVNLPLNETGVAQAKALATKLENLGVEIIYASPLKRALQTAQIAANYLHLEVKTLDDLSEGRLGICEGMYKQDIAKQFPDLWQEWYDDQMIMTSRWPGGESKLEMQQRMAKAFDTMLALPQKAIGVASHSGVMRYFLLKFGYGPHKLPNTALFHLIYDNGLWHLEQL